MTNTYPHATSAMEIPLQPKQNPGSTHPQHNQHAAQNALWNVEDPRRPNDTRAAYTNKYYVAAASSEEPRTRRLWQSCLFLFVAAVLITSVCIVVVKHTGYPQQTRATESGNDTDDENTAMLDRWMSTGSRNKVAKALSPQEKLSQEDATSVATQEHQKKLAEQYKDIVQKVTYTFFESQRSFTTAVRYLKLDMSAEDVESIVAQYKQLNLQDEIANRCEQLNHLLLRFGGLDTSGMTEFQQFLLDNEIFQSSRTSWVVTLLARPKEAARATLPTSAVILGKLEKALMMHVEADAALGDVVLSLRSKLADGAEIDALMSEYMKYDSENVMHRKFDLFRFVLGYVQPVIGNNILMESMREESVALETRMLQTLTTEMDRVMRSHTINAVQQAKEKSIHFLNSLREKIKERVESAMHGGQETAASSGVKSIRYNKKKPFVPIAPVNMDEQNDSDALTMDYPVPKGMELKWFNEQKRQVRKDRFAHDDLLEDVKNILN